MFLVAADIPASLLPAADGSAADAQRLLERLREVACPEDRVEHMHATAGAAGTTQLVLFLGHPDPAQSARCAFELVGRALPEQLTGEIGWERPVPLVQALERLALGPGVRVLPTQDPDTL